MVCTFFGHKDLSSDIDYVLHSVLSDLIDNRNVDTFYLGNQGNYDKSVLRVLKKLSNQYPQIKVTVVLAYLPTKRNQKINCDTLYPDGMENVPLKFAISKRNMWMIEKSDFVVTYVKHQTGNAAKFKEIAEKKGKTVINTATLKTDCLL